MTTKKSILFIIPDYHCSFFYRDEFRKLGWKADIYVPWSYPSKLLYSDQDIIRPLKIANEKIKLNRFLNHLLMLFSWLSKFWKYKFHLYYGRPPIITFFDKKLKLNKIFGEDFLIELWLAKLFRIKLIFLPTGCHDEESKENFSKLDDGKVCDNCGFFNKCSDLENNQSFSRIRRYFDLQIGVGTINTSQFPFTHIKFKSINLNLWNPDLNIPSKYKLPKTNNIRILHSTYLEKSGRNWKERNIKGSPYVIEAINLLKDEGFPVEYFSVINKPSNQMRFYQAQADIVVEQLIYGWYGSTFVETSALGKPVICYLRPSWKKFFLKTFPEYDSLPIVEADTKTIYKSLKKLVEDADLRFQIGLDSRRFAEQHFNPEKNTKNLIKILMGI